jgi:hypothetical protein
MIPSGCHCQVGPNMSRAARDWSGSDPKQPLRTVRQRVGSLPPHFILAAYRIGFTLWLISHSSNSFARSLQSRESSSCLKCGTEVDFSPLLT